MWLCIPALIRFPAVVSVLCHAHGQPPSFSLLWPPTKFIPALFHFQGQTQNECYRQCQLPLYLWKHFFSTVQFKYISFRIKKCLIFGAQKHLSLQELSRKGNDCSVLEKYSAHNISPPILSFYVCLYFYLWLSLGLYILVPLILSRNYIEIYIYILIY